MKEYKNTNGVDWLFHPFEFAFCGYSGCGKTTLITKVIKSLSPIYKIGFVKHDVHKFEVDHEGKDTYLARSAGASFIMIHNNSQCMQIHTNPPSPIEQNISLLDADIIIVEGHKNTKIPKFIFVDPEEKILNEFQRSPWENVIGFIGEENERRGKIYGYPYYNKNDTSSIQYQINEIISTRTKNIELFGLVLAGGRSERLRIEKASLCYHGVSQVEYSYNLLKKVCKKVFISNRKEQASRPHFKDFSQIHDRFLDFGPLGGILTAMILFPNVAWLVLGCDMPFVDLETINKLVTERNPLKMATAFVYTDRAVTEPLCTIYEPKILTRLLQCIGLGYSYPLKALMHSEIKSIPLKDDSKLRNINTIEDLRKTFQDLRVLKR